MLGNTLVRENQQKMQSGSIDYTKSFFVVPSFQPSLNTLYLCIVNTYNIPEYVGGQRYKEFRLGMQHNAPTHLPSYCIFRLAELSWAQFDYMHCAERKLSNQQILTWNNQCSNLQTNKAIRNESYYFMLKQTCLSCGLTFDINIRNYAIY